MNPRLDDHAIAREITDQYERIAEEACQRLANNQRVRRNLPGGGRLRIDRQLPFLCLHRGERDDAGTRELVTTEAAYLFASSKESHHVGLSHLCAAITESMQEHYGTFLLIEVWSGDVCEEYTRPGFKIVTPEADAIPSTIDAFEKSLQTIRVGGKQSRVQRIDSAVADVRGLLSLTSDGSVQDGGGCSTIGLIVEPIYRDGESGVIYPVVLQRLRWKLATAFRKTISHFTGNRKRKFESHHDSFGPSSLVRAARMVDQQLAEVSSAFDFLLQVTPSNADDVRKLFMETGRFELPQLQYRHLPYHPNLLKRRLFGIEIERIEDPTLAHLFWQKQDEVDRQLTSLRDLHAPEIAMQDDTQPSNFLTSSLQLYGGAEESLVDLAEQILRQFPGGRKKKKSRQDDKCVDASELASAAQEEIDYYQTQMNEFDATVEVSESIAAGIMVSRDRLLVSSNVNISRKRLAPLLHHEIGTHLLTYFNGRCQPFQQLYAGLAGYEELQEGLAVLAEYLVGGLTSNRLRILAARVMAVHWMVEGKSFRSVFNRLHERHRFPRRQAFTTTLRVFRGGGLTKDIIYLRGLRDLLDYLAEGHDIEPLYVGKIGLQHVPHIQELRRREIITPPRILPRFLDDESIRERLEAVRGKSVLGLMESD